MLRRRTIAASPLRGASATWQVITDLVTDTIATASALSRADAAEAMSVAAPAGRMLIAGGHLDMNPLTLVADLVFCEITTVSGAAALTAEENLNPVPGAAGADTFTIYLPSPDPLGELVSAAIAGHARLSSSVPVAEPHAEANSRPLIDLSALRKEVSRR
jgi:hypothetical protein